MAALAQLRGELVTRAEIALHVRMPPDFIRGDSAEAAAVDHRVERNHTGCDRAVAVRQVEVKAPPRAWQLEWRAVGAGAPKFSGCDRAEVAVFAACQAVTFHQHLAIRRIERDG